MVLWPNPSKYRKPSLRPLSRPERPTDARSAITDSASERPTRRSPVRKSGLVLFEFIWYGRGLGKPRCGVRRYEEAMFSYSKAISTAKERECAATTVSKFLPFFDLQDHFFEKLYDGFATLSPTTLVAWQPGGGLGGIAETVWGE